MGEDIRGAQQETRSSRVIPEQALRHCRDVLIRKRLPLSRSRVEAAWIKYGLRNVGAVAVEHRGRGRKGARGAARRSQRKRFGDRIPWRRTYSNACPRNGLVPLFVDPKLEWIVAAIDQFREDSPRRDPPVEMPSFIELVTPYRTAHRTGAQKFSSYPSLREGSRSSGCWRPVVSVARLIKTWLPGDAAQE